MNIWFYLDEAHAHMFKSDQINPDYASMPLPRLLSVHCKGSGGFELFFVGTKLFYRNLLPSYDLPSINTQATLLHDFEVKNWYALGVEFDKPKMFSKGQISVTSSFLLTKSFPGCADRDQSRIEAYSEP